jgi:hypothetical protein
LTLLAGKAIGVSVWGGQAENTEIARREGDVNNASCEDLRNAVERNTDRLARVAAKSAAASERSLDIDPKAVAVLPSCATKCVVLSSH